MNASDEHYSDQHNDLASFEGLRSLRPRIGILLVGHPDYPNDVGLRMAEASAARLRERGIEAVVSPRILLTRGEALAEAPAFASEGYDGIIIFLSTWIECPAAMAALREIEHLPFAVWGFPQFVNDAGKKDSTGSFVALSVFKATLDRMDYRYTWIAGLPEDDVAITRAETWARAALTIRALRRSAIGLIGYASMGMYPAMFDAVRLRKEIGPEVIHIDTATLLARMESICEGRREAVLADLRHRAGIDPAAPAHYLPKIAAMACALGEICREYELDAIDLKCQYELSQDYGCTGCVPLSLLADLGVVAGCEGDIPTTVTQAMLALLTGEVTTYGDLLDWENGEAVISPCGFAPFSLCKAAPVIREIAHPGFKGLLTSSVLRDGTVTLARFAQGPGGNRMQVLIGETLPTEPRQGRFPAARLRINESLDNILDHITSQHFAYVYGDRRALLMELCRLLGIRYIGQ